MTQHLQPEQTREDQQTMRRLGIVIGCFVLATIVLAVTVGIFVG